MAKMPETILMIDEKKDRLIIARIEDQVPCFEPFQRQKTDDEIRSEKYPGKDGNGTDPLNDPERFFPFDDLNIEIDRSE
jgi:hypothetical protein